MAAYHPREFSAIATIAGAPMRELVTRNMMAARVMGGLPPGKLPPVLLVMGENDGEVPLSWVEEDKASLESKGHRVDLKLIPGMAHEHDPRAVETVLEWLDSREQTP